MQRNEFIEYIIGDQLVGLPGMSARAMFSGFGLYREGVMIGLVIADELYLKVDETNRNTYEAMGSTPFSYERKDGKHITMSYWKVPAEVLEDRERLTLLVEESYDITLQNAMKKKRGTK